MLYNYHESFTLPASDWLRVIYHGLRLDLSAGAYLMFIPALLIISGIIPCNRIYMKAVDFYCFIFLFVIVFLGVSDMALYSYWGFKLDLTPVLMYIKTPGDALASVNILELLFLCLIFAIIYVSFLFIYRKLIKEPVHSFKQHNWKTTIALVLFVLLLFLPARGGIGLAPVNLGAVYFHSERFANHSAINVLWNSIYSLSEKSKLSISNRFMNDEKANEIFRELHPLTAVSEKKIIKNNPNIILIILESFSNKIIEPLGGEPGITPEFNKLCTEGLLFTNFFSSGDRSDKGLVSIFSGFPAQPVTSIINYPSKSQKLPFLKDSFFNDGYFTAFYYGGNLDFANFRSYFTRRSVSSITDIHSFPGTFKKQKWGVPDNYVYDKILNDLDTISQPFFISFFTLSSHEPFDIPAEPVFGSSGRDDMSRNAFYFADKCLGFFVNQARIKPWWDNTLIILIADHGSRSPGNTPNHTKEKFSIPMLWIGGALQEKPARNNIYASQVDLPATLLNQCGYNHTDFKYSKDIFSSLSCNFAFYSFHNGFGFLRDSVELIYDNAGGKFIHNSGEKTVSWYENGEAILQVITNDFLLL